MRVLAVVVLAACSNAARTGAFDVDKVVESTAREKRIDVHRRAVPLREMPMARWLAGLPMDGLADVDISLRAPIAGGATRFSQATGTFALVCATTCTLGDDKARLDVMRELAPDGVPFEHLTFDAIEIRGAVAGGHAKLTAWKIVSPDLVWTAAVDVTLDDDLATSTIDGCVRFAPKAALAKRSPRMYDLLSLTGASRGEDGMFSVKLEGTLDDIKRLPVPCD